MLRCSVTLAQVQKNQKVSKHTQQCSLHGNIYLYVLSLASISHLKLLAIPGHVSQKQQNPLIVLNLKKAWLIAYDYNF